MTVPEIAKLLGLTAQTVKSNFKYVVTHPAGRPSTGIVDENYFVDKINSLYTGDKIIDVRKEIFLKTRIVCKEYSVSKITLGKEVERFPRIKINSSLILYLESDLEALVKSKKLERRWQ